MTFRKYYQQPQSGKSEPRFKDGRDPAFISWLHSLPCCVTGIHAGDLIHVPFPNGKLGKVRAIIEAAHLKSRGASGVDVGNAVPLELYQHRLLHKEGRKSYPAKRGIDLQAIADELAERWRKLHPESALASRAPRHED